MTVFVALAVAASAMGVPAGTAQSASAAADEDGADVVVPEPDGTNDAPPSELPPGFDLAPIEPPPSCPGCQELPELRSETTRTYSRPGGGRALFAFPGAVHFRTEAGLVPIDNHLEARPGGGWHNRAGPYRAEFPPDAAGTVRITEGDHWVEFSLHEAQGTGIAEGSGVTYPDALPGVDLAYRAEGNRVKELLTLASPASPSSFSFDVAASAGLSLRQAADGGIDALDASGEAALRFPAPFMEDSSGGPEAVSTALSMTLAPSGDRVEVVADRAWLEDPGRVWPVVIDPATTIGGPWHSFTDTYIDSATPNSSYGSSGVLKVGGTYRALLRFDPLTDRVPPHAIIEEATLELDLLSRTGTATEVVGVFGLTRGFTSSATWNTSDGMTAWTSPGGDADATASVKVAVNGVGSYKSYPNELVQSWAAGDRAHLGVLLKGGTEVLNFGSFDAVDPADWPSLVVWYALREGNLDSYTTEQVRLSDRLTAEVNVANGNLLVTNRELAIAGTGVNLAVDHHYNNLDRGWTHGTGQDVRTHGLLGPPNLTLYGPNGYAAHFKRRPDGSFITPPGLKATLTQLSSTANQLDFEDQLYLTFDSAAVANSGGYGRMTEIADRSANTITIGYDFNANRMTGITDTQGRTVTFTYDASGRIERMRDNAGGRNWDYTYDATHPERIATITDPTNAVVSFGYDAAGNLIDITDARGNRTKVGYDTKRRVTSITRVTDPVAGTGPTTTFSYDQSLVPDCQVAALDGLFDASTVVTDANSGATRYCWDTEARVHKVIDPLGHRRDQSWTASSQVATFNGNAVSSVYNLSYDTSRNLTQFQAPASAGGQTGASNYLTYPAPSNSPNDFLPDSRTDAEGDCRAFGYDGDGRLTTVYDGLVPTQTMTGPTCAGATNANKSSQTFNPNGTLQSQTYPAAQANAALRMTCAGTSVSASVCYGYDAGNKNLTSITYPSGSNLGSITRAVDGLSRTASVTDGRGQKTCRRYDANDRIVQIDTAAGTTCPSLDAAHPNCSPSANRICYGYDANGNLTTRVDGTGATTFAYDPLSRPVRKVLPGGSGTTCGALVLNYTYDAVGNMASACDGGGTVTYRYNADNTLRDLAEPGGSCTTATPTLCTAFGYTDPTTGAFHDGRRVTTTYPTSTPVVLTATRDDAQRTKKVEAKAGTTVLTSYSYTYQTGTDDEQRRKTMRDDLAQATTTYGYDAQGRLTSADNSLGSTNDFTWAYDANGNRTSQVKGGTTTTYGYNLMSNQLTSVSTQMVTPIFDLAGNLTRSHADVAGTYNAKGQTASLDPPPAGSPVSLSYRDVDSTELASAGATTVRHSLLGVSSATNGMDTTYWVRDPNGTLISRRSGTTRHYYLFDGLGSVMGLATASGALANGYRYTYDPYGNQTSAAPAINDPWRYASGLDMRFVDSGLPLTKFGTRYYDPAVGRWTQQDPLAGVISDPATVNRYPYVGSNPVNSVDPSGYDFIDVGGEVCYFVCISGGITIDGDGGISPYIGAGIGVPGAGGGATYSPGTSSEGFGGNVSCSAGFAKVGLDNDLNPSAGVGTYASTPTCGGGATYHF